MSSSPFVPRRRNPLLRESFVISGICDCTITIKQGDSSRNLRPTDIWFNGTTANGYRVQPMYTKVYIRWHIPSFNRNTSQSRSKAFNCIVWFNTLSCRLLKVVIWVNMYSILSSKSKIELHFLFYYYKNSDSIQWRAIEPPKSHVNWNPLFANYPWQYWPKRSQLLLIFC